MKKTLITLIFCINLFSDHTVAQIEIKPTAKENTIGEVRYGVNFCASIKSKIYDNDTVYYYMFQNAEYQSISDIQIISFSGTKTLNDLYGLLKSVFLPENKKNKDYKVSFKLGETDCTIRTERAMGITGVWFWTEKGYRSYTEREVNKLFGRKD